MKSVYALLALIMVQALPWGLPPAMAEDDHLEARRLVESGEVLSLQSILDKYRVDYPGRVIEVELENKRDQIIYEIEIVDDSGEVRELHINARNGELLQDKRED